ncbi:hypothetical protein V5799_010946 [Amblyomma americanum]|uniref:Uncharacterized protein n=1 Tax=Amblyomma americanum TaxID=6943 RepID=A0AAQ4EIA1_AMBAM
MLVGTLAIFFFCFLVGLLFYYFFTGPNLPIAVACISDECLQAKEDLDNLLNDAKKPCADFYGHVCDSWSNTTSSFHAGIAGRQLAKMNASLFQNVKIKRDEDRRYGVHLLRPVYRRALFE